MKNNDFKTIKIWKEPPANITIHVDNKDNKYSDELKNQNNYVKLKVNGSYKYIFYLKDNKLDSILSKFNINHYRISPADRTLFIYNSMLVENFVILQYVLKACKCNINNIILKSRN